jgi:hypothetical protein
LSDIEQIADSVLEAWLVQPVMLGAHINHSGTKRIQARTLC